jgi:hypothetical protein
LSDKRIREIAQLSLTLHRESYLPRARRTAVKVTFTSVVLGTNGTMGDALFSAGLLIKFKETIRSSSMLRQILHRLTAGALIVLLPATVLSADAGTAMLTSGQRVLVNGKQAQGRQAVMQGDAVQNNDVNVAILSVPGATVSVGAHSTIVYQNDSIQVTGGAANFKTQGQMAAQYGEITVRPIAPDTQFVVGEISGKRVVAALHGSVLVSNGKYEMTLPEGKALTQDTRPRPPIEGKDTKPDSAKTSGDPRDREKGGFVLPGWAEVVIIGGAIAGVFGGLTAAGFFDKTSGQ